jgi:hypothetical protein
VIQIRREKEAIKQERIEKESLFAQRRQIDYVNALDQEFKEAESLRQEQMSKNAAKLEQHHEILSNKGRDKQIKNMAFCKAIAQSTAELAIKVIILLDPTRKLTIKHDIFICTRLETISS